MAEDLRVNIIADASQAERALRGVEAEAAKVANSMKAVGNAAQQAAQQISQTTNTAIGDMRRLGNEAERAAAKVAAANRAYTSGVNARQINRAAGPSPFPTATGGGFDAGGGSPIGFGNLGGGGFGGLGGLAAAAYAVHYVGEGGVNYAESFDSAFSPEGRALGSQTSLQAAKTLGVNATSAFNSYAAALKTTADALTEAERKQAVLNAAMGKGAAIVAESEAYRATPGGALAGIKEFGSNLQEAVFLRFYATLTGSFPGVVGAGIGGGPGRGLAAGGGNDFAGLGATIRSRFGQFQGGIDAQHASNAAFFAATGGDFGGYNSPGALAAFNQQQYADAATRYRAQQANAQAGYLGGVNNLVSLENQRGRFNESLQFNPGEGYTGTSTVFGETDAERTARIFSTADSINPALRNRFLAGVAGGLNPASLSADQRSTIRQALDQSVLDQLNELQTQSEILGRIETLLKNATQKAGADPGHLHDAEDTPTTTVVIENQDATHQVRFKDDGTGFSFTQVNDSLTEDARY